jgi:hypothetical protein
LFSHSLFGKSAAVQQDSGQVTVSPDTLPASTSSSHNLSLEQDSLAAIVTDDSSCVDSFEGAAVPETNSCKEAEWTLSKEKAEWQTILMGSTICPIEWEKIIFGYINMEPISPPKYIWREPPGIWIVDRIRESLYAIAQTVSPSSAKSSDSDQQSNPQQPQPAIVSF